MQSFITCMPHQLLLRWSSPERWEVHTKFWSENLKGRNHSQDLGTDGKIILETDLMEIKWEGVEWMQPVQVNW